MRNLTLAMIGFVASGSLAGISFAEQIDNTQTLPDAKPGECYAKVITPAKFETTTEEVILQEASERIEAVEAVYETAEQPILIQEASQKLTVTDAVFETEVEQVEIRASELAWSMKRGAALIPANPDALQMIGQSGIDLTSVAPGSCFVEYFTEARYDTVTESVLKKSAYQVVSIVPAEFEEVEERVLVKEASTRVVDVPAVYRTEQESVLVEPARSVWKQGCGMVEQVENSTGETMCLVRVPARYETLTKTVLDTPATTRTETIPAVYETISVKRMVKPAAEQRKDVPAEYTTISKRVKAADPEFFWLSKGEEAKAGAKPAGREICLTERAAETVNMSQALLSKPVEVESEEIPATFESVKVQKLVSSASERRIVVPARTRTVTSQTQTEPSKLEWRKVLCESNMTPRLISSLQSALKREGYNPGPVDGIVGRSTMEALEQFQVDQSIDRRGLTFEALQLLDVNP
ncbi:MAG: peptidoglycan-binding protein [Granulosicoccus sp.]